jgi:hypothetical protein
MKQNPINHVTLVLDASPSMEKQVDTVIAVADNQIKFLAERSKQLEMETRVTVYMFSSPYGGSDGFECLCYDMDVLRLPSLQGEYKLLNGWTALIDATIRSQNELKQTATLYGKHAFLTFILTDGIENRSKHKPADLRKLIEEQGDSETMGILVPDVNAKLSCQDMGFPKANVAIWDATSTAGLEEAGEVIRQATDVYMTNLSRGVTNKGVFDMSPTVVNHKTVAALKEIVSGIEILPVKAAMDITTFITKQHGRTFRQGKYYFPLVKREKVGPQKNVVVRHKISGKVFGGPEVRTLLGLPDHEVSIKPGINAEYDVFVQSTSTNRNLIPGHDLLVIE